MKFFFDVKRAFDCVPHTLILQSLSSVGISGPLLSWFEDYLTGRQQMVVVDGVSSRFLQLHQESHRV